MSDIYPSLSYITASGQEIVLANSASRKQIELYIREGFGAPSIKTEERKYANGAVRIIAAMLQPRDVTIQMFISGDTKAERDSIFYGLVAALFQTGTKDDWGKLVVARMDGKQVYLNCLYTSGMDEVVECYKKYHQFPLKFRAGDPYFYDFNETVITSERTQELVYLNSELYLGNWTLTDGFSDITIDNDGEVFYPIFEVYGPASAIAITNYTTNQILSMDSDFTLLANEKLTIDCRENRRRIILTDEGGNDTDVTYRLALGSSLLFPIVKGQNVIQCKFVDISDDSTFSVRYQKRYLSA